MVSSEAVASQVAEGKPAAENRRLSEARRRLPVNIMSNAAWMLIQTLVNLWYTPFLIAHLGVAVYGLIPLVTSIANYLSLLTDGFNSAISRFLQIALAREDSTEMNRVFNTGVAGALTIFTIFLPVSLLLSWLTPRVFNVPTGHEQDAQLLVLLTILAFAVSCFSSIFAVSSYSLSRFDLRLLVNIFRVVVQMGCLVLMFALLRPQLWQVGLGILLSALLFLIGHTTLWRRLTPQLKFNIGLFDWLQLKQMLNFSGWVLVNQAGVQLFLNIDLIIANLIFGVHTAGRYGAVIILPSLLRSFVGTISSVIEPMVFTIYAQNDPERLARFCKRAVRFMGLIVALPIGLLCGLARPILTIWLGPDYADLSWLVVALVGHLCINLAVVPLFSIQVSTNHVRVPGVLTLVMGVTNACLAVALALWSGWGYISIGIAGAIVLTAKNAVFTPLYNAHILHLPWWTFLRNLSTSVVAWLAVFIISFWISLTFAITGLPQLALVGMLVGCLYLLVIYFIGLNKDDRSFLKKEIRQRIGK